MLVYPVADDEDDFVTLGFALHFPPNRLEKRLAWTVRAQGRNGEAAPAVVDRPAR
jgi:hypothetical protein